MDYKQQPTATTLYSWEVAVTQVALAALPNQATLVTQALQALQQWPCNAWMPMQPQPEWQGACH